MRADTRDALIEINRSFYDFHAAGFDASRQRAWRGWEELWELSSASSEGSPGRPLRVLDAGCGNGRFALFLRERAAAIDYLGLDIAPALLDSAGRSLEETGLNVRLREHDLLRDPLVLEERFDWIGLYGVLHHLPGFEQRVALVRNLAKGLAPNSMAPGGMLSMSWWCFDRLPKWQSKTLPWEDYNRNAKRPVDLEDLEPGDHLLTWSGETSHPRYCHAPDEAEIEAFINKIATPDLSCTSRFFADGPSGTSNLYLVFS